MIFIDDVIVYVILILAHTSLALDFPTKIECDIFLPSFLIVYLCHTFLSDSIDSTNFK